jgi:flagellar export protein FliJ
MKHKEQEFLAEHPQLIFSYSNYSIGVKDKELILRQDIEAIEQTIVIARNRLSESFSNLKRYELALDKKMAEKKIEDDRKENIMMDEISTNGYIRKAVE